MKTFKDLKFGPPAIGNGLHAIGYAMKRRT